MVNGYCHGDMLGVTFCSYDLSPLVSLRRSFLYLLTLHRLYIYRFVCIAWVRTLQISAKPTRLIVDVKRRQSAGTDGDELHFVNVSFRHEQSSSFQPVSHMGDVAYHNLLQ